MAEKGIFSEKLIPAQGIPGQDRMGKLQLYAVKSF
jgi:hypothetical protein